jgi:tetratricopeptide (TPR) repeat protein
VLTGKTGIRNGIIGAASNTNAAGIAAENWGEASALHVYAAAFGLPEPVCGDGWFYFETLRRDSLPERYVSMGDSRSQLERMFRHVQSRKIFRNRYCIPHEDGREIFYCSDPKVDLRRYFIVSRQMDPRFREVMRTEGVPQAAAYYRRLKAQDPGTFLFSEQQMNSLGYEYLGKGKVNEAIMLFTLNVEAFPESFNVYDSLGEAQMADHQYALAVRNYTRSLEINPGNGNARKKLEELKTLAGP